MTAIAMLTALVKGFDDRIKLVREYQETHQFPDVRPELGTLRQIRSLLHHAGDLLVANADKWLPNISELGETKNRTS